MPGYSVDPTLSVASAIWADAAKTSIRVQTRDGRFLLVPDDPANSDRASLARENVVIADFVTPPTPVPEQISDVQFYMGLSLRGIITRDEAEASTAAVLPTSLSNLIGGLPADQQFFARMKLKGATLFERRNPLTVTLAAMFGWDDAQTDEFWRFCATL